MPTRPILSLSASAGAPCGATVSNTRYFFLRYGSNILCAAITWRNASGGENNNLKNSPVFASGGWADAYSNAIPRLLAGLKAPRKGLIGPWAHLYPHDGVPGPAIGFLQEALRWVDTRLRGTDTGIMAEPMLRIWMQESVPPKPFYKHR